MPETLAQIDIRNLRARILHRRTPIKEKCSACETLLEFYPSGRNKKFVYHFIRQHKTKRYRGAVRDLHERLLNEKILERRQSVRRYKVLSTPPAGALIAPGSDGAEYYADKNGNILGKVPVKSEPSNEPVLRFYPYTQNDNQT
jgi:hypothetical protein